MTPTSRISRENLSSPILICMVLEFNQSEIIDINDFPYFRLTRDQFPFPIPTIRGKALLDFLPADVRMSGDNFAMAVEDPDLPPDLRHFLTRKRASARQEAENLALFNQWQEDFLARYPPAEQAPVGQAPEEEVLVVLM